jgi:hypothetical protein
MSTTTNTRRIQRPRLNQQTPTSEARTPAPPAMTPIEYSGLQTAYDHFNAELFDGALGDVFMAYQRNANSLGHFAPGRYSSRVGADGRHELALNPDGFLGHTDKAIVQTLVHEQCHVWQYQHGKPAARGYHNREWAAKMKAIGLQPSSTGMLGGKETGQRMSAYILPGGRFERSYERLAATGWKLNLHSAPRPGQQRGPTNSKTKFTCPTCGQNAWGKPELSIGCIPCGLRMVNGAVQSYDTSERSAA